MLAQEPDQVVLALPGRGEAQLELGHRSPRDAPGLELDQGSLAGGVLHQDVVEVLGGQRVQAHNRPFELPLPAGARRLLQDDPRLLSQQPQRSLEIKVLDQLDEAELIAALATAVAMPQLLFRRYI